MKFLKKLSSYIPDRYYIKWVYYKHLKKWPNLNKPISFTEKIQWLKLYNRNPLYTIMVDKDKVKDLVASKIGKEYIIQTIGRWSCFEDIDFNSLPNKFVLKTTHDSGGVVICKNKQNLNLQEIKEKLTSSLKRNFYKTFREYPYKNVKPIIIAEEFLESYNNEELTDYKIFCFNGCPKYIQVIKDRSTKETIDFFDTNWIHQEFIGLTPNVSNAKNEIPCPPNFHKMLEIAEILSADIPFVRIDLYNIKGKIKFGEITFYPNAGLGQFMPKKWNKILGDMIALPT